MGFSEEELQAQARELQAKLSQELAGTQEEGDSLVSHYDNIPADPYENIEAEPEEEQDPFKKYVVRVNNEHTPLIEQLSYDDRNTFFNELLDEYIRQDIAAEKAELLSQRIKKIVVILLIVCVGIPFSFWFLSTSLTFTQTNYKDMQNNFEKLFENRKVRSRR